MLDVFKRFFTSAIIGVRIQEHVLIQSYAENIEFCENKKIMNSKILTEI